MLRENESECRDKAMETTLYGFTKGAIQPLGQVVLLVRLGEPSLQTIRMVNFLVVGAPSAYNVIQGRPSLNLFQVVVSTYYMKLKFSVEDSVGEVAGDQLCYRKCYVETVKRAAHSSPQEKSQKMDSAGKKMKIVEAMEHNSDCQMNPEEDLMSIEFSPNEVEFNTPIKAHKGLFTFTPKSSADRNSEVALLSLEKNLGVELDQKKI